MRIPDWQNAAVVLAVLAAVVYLGYRVYAVIVRRKRTGCSGGCNTCPSSAAPSEQTESGTVVSIEQFTASAQRIQPKPRR
jgi:hypothetical protein